MLTTEALIADIKEDDSKAAGAGGPGHGGGGGGGMGGMYKTSRIAKPTHGAPEPFTRFGRFFSA